MYELYGSEDTDLSRLDEQGHVTIQPHNLLRTFTGDEALNATYFERSVGGVPVNLTQPVFIWNHTGLTPGATWQYRLVTRNRGPYMTDGVVFNATALTCPQLPDGVPQVVYTYDTAKYMVWTKATPEITGYDRYANIRYNLFAKDGAAADGVAVSFV